MPPAHNAFERGCGHFTLICEIKSLSGIKIVLFELIVCGIFDSNRKEFDTIAFVGLHFVRIT